MSPDVLSTFGSSKKSKKNPDKMESTMISRFSSVTNTASTTDDDEEEKISPKKLDFAERILKWEQLVTPNANKLRCNRAKGVERRDWRDANDWKKNKANVKLCANEPFFNRNIVNRAYPSTNGREVGGSEKIRESGIAGRKRSNEEEKVQEAEKVEVSVQRSIFRVKVNDEREAIGKKLAAYHPHLLAQTRSVRSGTAITSDHCSPITTTIATITNSNISSSTVATAAVTLPQSSNCCANTLISEQYFTVGSSDSKAKGMMLATVQSASSSSHSSDDNSTSSRLHDEHADVNPVKDKNGEKDNLNEKERMEEEEKEEDDIAAPIQLIRQSSEEGFNQVVKFKRRVTRRGEAKDPESKSSTCMEFNEQGKLLSEKKNDPCVVRVSKDLTNQGLDNRTICVKQNLSGDIQSESEYCNPTEKTCLASANDDNRELKIFNCGTICAKMEEIRETTTKVGNLSNSMQKQQDQRKCDEAEISVVIGGPQADDKSEMFV